MKKDIDFEAELKKIVKLWLLTLTIITQFIYDEINSTCMVRKKLTDDEKQEQQDQQKIRAKASRSARRSGKINKKEGKVNKAKEKTKTPRSQKKIATVKKSRY